MTSHQATLATRRNSANRGFADLSFTETAHGAKIINAGGEDLFWRYGRLSAICLRQIDLLARPKDNSLPGLDIGRHSPQPQRHVERIDAQCGPERKLADPMLFRMVVPLGVV